MHLKNNEVNELSSIAIKAAKAAGDIISKAQGQSIKLQSKVGGENMASQVVTVTDLAAQRIIIEILTPTINKFDFGLLAEETTDDHSRLKKDYFWCIDPLDGTLSFSRNEDGYSTSIALVDRSGMTIIGVVYNPRTNDLYHAIKGGGAFKNGKKLVIANAAQHLTLLFDQSFLKREDFVNELEMLRVNSKNLGLKDVVLHPLGGAVMNGISTIELVPAIYYKHPKKSLGGGSLWDFAASSIIQAEAGGFNSSYFGNPLDLNRADSTFMNQQGVIFSSSEYLAQKLLNKD